MCSTAALGCQFLEANPTTFEWGKNMQSKKIYSSLSLSLSIKYKFPTIATATFA
jgi:hypothetical protein